MKQSTIHKALGNPLRLFIMKELYNSSLKKSVGTINKKCVEFKFSDSAISQHLKKLKHFGLLKQEKKGRLIFYYIPTELKPILKNYLIQENKK